MNSQQYHSATWQHGEVCLRCVERWQETHDVTSFRFQGEQSVKFHFKPGQFITLMLNINGKAVARSYTISSSPSRPYSIVVTIKRIEGGVASNYLVDHLQPGHSVTARGPDGAFNLVDINADKYLFLSAGSGITPMYSMSRWLTDTQVGSNIALFHSAKSPQDLIFHQPLQQLAQRNEHFSLTYCLEEGEINDTDTYQGRISLASLVSAVADYKERTIFVCGPAPYMQAVKTMLEQAGFDMSRYHQESFGDAPVVPLPSAAVADSAKFMLHIGDVKTPLSAKQTVLEGIEAEGLPIIAACRSGVCGACKCKVERGETQSSSSMTLTPDEIEQGYILACSTTLKSDVLLSLNG
ncbi:hybrid-cluster NAD(P)-dependent oxidoreductase [Shewanella colwelliana]|uniref:hybrid-cluster NAD(P)-dependent oxidoreductase n=1 Tax=Shewanella colwelliana TaxID=23 RepID=UPI001BC3D43C|nr:hybrid-cluster NAD(P)-dependent oxidoreductase [Shewanella colwelliana]GIU24946.1 hybrid-cluster NAD(P)-dependent oxidoreductase [Shewanella colwelliana]